MTRARGRPPKIAAPYGRISRVRRPDGTQAYRLRGDHEGRTLSLGYYDTLEEALRASAAALVEREGRPEGLTLGGWVETWLDERERARLHRSVSDMRAIARRYVVGSTVADMELRRVQPEHVRAWLMELATRERAGKRLAEQTLRNALHLLSAACRGAMDAGRLRANPCAGVRVPRRPRTDETWTYLSQPEIERVLACPLLDDPRAVAAGCRSALTVAIYAGLREGELWGLRWTDVHLDDADPHAIVRHSYDGPTKGGKPRRVPLLPPAVDALRDWRPVQRETQLRRHHRTGAPIPLRGLVWPAADGTCRSEGYDARWPAVREWAQLGRRVRFHDLRHTCASHLVSGTWGRTWTIDEVQHLLGHTERSTTERYAHLAPDARIRAEREARAAWGIGRDSGEGGRSR